MPVVPAPRLCYTAGMDTGSRPSRLHRLAPAATVALLAAPLAAGAFVSTGWSWGWDHLHRVPAAWPVLLLLLSALLCFPPASRRFPALFEATGEALARRPALWPALAAAAAFAAFTAFPVATRMYGDSQAILNHHGPGDLALHLRRVLEPGIATRGSAVALLHDLAERLPGLGYEAAWRLVSALCGAAFVLVHLRLAATLPGLRGWARAAIAWLGLVDGGNQLFFGHVETYTVPRLVASLFLVMAVRRLLAPAAPLTPRRALVALPALAATLLHVQWVVLAPAVVLLLARDLAAARPGRPAAPRGLAAWAGARGAAALAAAGVALVALAYVATGAWCHDYLYTGGMPEPRQVLLPLSTACCAEPWLRYSVFSGAHLADLAGSLWSISSPAVLLVLAVTWRRWREAGAGALAVTAFAALLHDLVLNPSIGFPFDWDLMCVASPPLLYAAVLMLAAAGARAPAPAWLPWLLVLGLGTATVFAVNGGRESAYRRVEDMAVWLHRSYHGGSHYRLGGNLSTVADEAEQLRERERVLARLGPQAFPGDAEVAFLWERLGRLRAARKDFPAALAAYRAALAAEPAGWARRKEAAWLETEAGDESVGLALLESYLEHAPGDAEAWRHLGLVRARRGEDGAARSAWERFLRLSPDGAGAAEARRDLEALDRRQGR